MLTNTIINKTQSIQPTYNSDDELDQISNITFLILLTCTTIISPIIEEFFFRGIFLLKLKDHSNIVVALIFSTFVFSILHSSGLGEISAFISGLLFGFIAIKTSSIFYSIIAHILFNSLTTIFGVASKYSNAIQLINGTFYFNTIINIVSVAIFIITLFVMFKMPLGNLKS